MNREIGSDFSLEKYTNEEKTEIMSLLDNCFLCYSGRTALHYILLDIVKDNRISRAWMPSYCCDSMIQPFLDLSIPVVYYDVNFDDEKKQIVRSLRTLKLEQGDLVLTMAYFGAVEKQNESIIKKCVNENIIVIEDCTHKFLSELPDKSLAHYSFASIRKWFPLASGGIVWKNGEQFCSMGQKPNPDLINLRKRAMLEKRNYLESRENEDMDLDKKLFLEKFYKCNYAFYENYQQFRIDEWSFSVLKNQDVNKIKEERIENARYIYHEIRRIPGIRLLINKFQYNECPFFIPILVKNRDELQRFLIGNNMFFPSHWPNSDKNRKSNIYNSILSIVCDHRYRIEDMERIIKVLQEFYC